MKFELAQVALEVAKAILPSLKSAMLTGGLPAVKTLVLAKLSVIGSTLGPIGIVIGILGGLAIANYICEHWDEILAKIES
jgi:hypothetical protein